MPDLLQIPYPRERMAVRAVDLVLTPFGWAARLRRRVRAQAPRRILLLRLERIGDLLMTLAAIRVVRQLAPDAEIDLVVGGWNEALAGLIPGITRVEALDLPWVARGTPGASLRSAAARAASWRSRRYDLAINFEGDIRSHALMSLSGAARRVGFAHAGGGPLLTDVVVHDPGRHVADNGLALVECAFGLARGSLPRPSSPEGARLSRLPVPEAARGAAHVMVRQRSPSAAVADAPWLAVHAPAGRLVKQWPVERFAEAAIALARQAGATVLLTGASGDEAMVTDLARRLSAAGVPIVSLQGRLDLVLLAAALERCLLLLTGDTGPMHLAAAVGTPVLAVFGPSMPWRYGPLVEPHRVVRVDLPCSPCNRIRLPPARCQGHAPDCLAGVDAAAVIAAGRSLLATNRPPAGAAVR